MHAEHFRASLPVNAGALPKPGTPRQHCPRRDRILQAVGQDSLGGAPLQPLFFFKSALGFGKLLGVDVCLLPLPLGIFAIEASDAASRTPGKEHGSLPDLTPPFSQALHAGNFNGLRLIIFLLRQQGIHLCLNSIALVRCMLCQCYGLLQDTKRLVALRQCRALRNQSRKLLLPLRSEATLRKLRSKRPESLRPTLGSALQPTRRRSPAA